MNERQEQTADVLGKLTVLGTIVLPMNIVTGMWGMNVLVPGQDVDNLNWFWSSKSWLPPFDPIRSVGQTEKANCHCSQRWTVHIRVLVLLHREESLWHCMIFLQVVRWEKGPIKCMVKVHGLVGEEKKYKRRVSAARLIHGLGGQ